MNREAQVTKFGALDMQVCVPTDWEDQQVLDFAERQYPCGTRNGWFVRKQGDEALMGCEERVNCVERDGFVHIMLDA